MQVAYPECTTKINGSWFHDLLLFWADGRKFWNQGPFFIFRLHQKCSPKKASLGNGLRLNSLGLPPRILSGRMSGPDSSESHSENTGKRSSVLYIIQREPTEGCVFLPQSKPISSD